MALIVFARTSRPAYHGRGPAEEGRSEEERRRRRTTFPVLNGRRHCPRRGAVIKGYRRVVTDPAKKEVAGREHEKREIPIVLQIVNAQARVTGIYFVIFVRFLYGQSAVVVLLSFFFPRVTRARRLTGEFTWRIIFFWSFRLNRDHTSNFPTTRLLRWRIRQRWTYPSRSG